VIRHSIKGRKTPHSLTKDTVLGHTGSNVIGFVFRNSNQKGVNPLKGGKITCLLVIILQKLIELLMSLLWGLNIIQP